MQRFKNILLALDPDIDSQAVLHKAVALAEENHARLTLASVVDVPTSAIHSYDPAQILETLTEYRREWLGQQLEKLSLPKADAVLLEGITFLEIIRKVLRDHHDLVVLAAEEHHGVAERLFGSTSMNLMRKCPCPVWVVKRAQIHAHEKIMAALDPAFCEPERDSLNTLILQLANSMTRREQAELHIVHAWRLFGEKYIRSFMCMSREDLQQAKSKERTMRMQRIQILMSESQVDKLKPRLHLVEGKPYKQIIKQAREQNIDLLVIGTVCRTGIKGFIIGNTAEEVLNHVNCSVLTVKPNGFVTPATLEDAA